MKHNVLLDELRAAFPPEPIIAKDAFQHRGRLYCDGEEYRREMDGRTWEQLDPQYFALRSDGLSFLGTPYIVMVLPLYLNLLIVFKPSSPVPETLLPQLTKPEPDEGGEFDLYDELVIRFDELTNSLTDRQSRAVAATLVHFIELYPAMLESAQPALDRYWCAFEPSACVT